MTQKQSFVVDVGAHNFREAVVERSLKVPVLVDFWATWCGPCRTLGPLLEKLAAEYAGAFVLAKVDTDREVELAQMFQIQSIPSVKLVVGGRLVDGFDGALPEAALRKFLSAHVRPLGDPLDDARAALEEGDGEGALAVLEQILSEQPERQEARLLFAEAAFAVGDLHSASKVLSELGEEQRQSPAGRALAARLELAARPAVDLSPLEAAAKARPADPAAQIEWGRALAAAGQWEQALEVLLAAVALDREYGDQAARRAMLEVFEALGADHDLAVDYRRQLQMLLFV